MTNSTIRDINVNSVEPFSNDGYIENDIAMFDNFQNLPIPNEPSRIKGLIIGLCLHGKAQYTVETEERLITKNDVIIINDNQVTDNYMISPDFQGIAMIISNNFFNDAVKGVNDISSLFIFTRNHPVFKLDEEQAILVTWYYNMLKIKVNESNNHFRKDIVRSLFNTMIYDVSNIIYSLMKISDKKRSRADTIFTEFIRLVESNFRKERRVSWYGEQMCITPKYLSETVKQISKRTPNEWIDKYVTLEVRVQLKNTAKSIKEIAEDLHFPNQSFLGKYFKEHSGMSPSEYRKS